MIAKKYVTQEKAIASYNWEDISDGTGLVTLYGCISMASGATTYNLIQNKVLGAGVNNVSDVIVQNDTYSFNLATFNMPKTIFGTAYLSCEAYGNSTSHVIIAAKLVKYDGSTDTDLTDTITSADYITAGVTAGIFLKIPITTRIHFQQGDTLVLRIALQGAGADKRVGVNPMGTSTLEPLICQIPFVANPQ